MALEPEGQRDLRDEGSDFEREDGVPRGFITVLFVRT